MSFLCINCSDTYYKRLNIIKLEPADYLKTKIEECLRLILTCQSRLITNCLQEKALDPRSNRPQTSGMRLISTSLFPYLLSRSLFPMSFNDLFNDFLYKRYK